VTAGPSDDERAGGDAPTVASAGTSVEAGVVDTVLRGAAAGAAVLFRVCACVGGDDISREKSSPIFRVASQPDKSSSPIPTVRVIRRLIVILSTQRHASRKP
jgi:hypothetical protein